MRIGCCSYDLLMAPGTATGANWVSAFALSYLIRIISQLPEYNKIGLKVIIRLRRFRMGGFNITGESLFSKERFSRLVGHIKLGYQRSRPNQAATFNSRSSMVEKPSPIVSSAG